MEQVLVVEDNEDNMKVITFILEKSGYKTLQAEDGRTGIALALKEEPDFVILDIQLPDMNGMDVVKAIRKSERIKNTPVIAITSYAVEGDRERMLSGGCDGYIEKPIDPVNIIKQIREILGNKP